VGKVQHQLALAHPTQAADGLGDGRLAAAGGQGVQMFGAADEVGVGRGQVDEGEGGFWLPLQIEGLVNRAGIGLNGAIGVAADVLGIFGHDCRAVLFLCAEVECLADFPLIALDKTIDVAFDLNIVNTLGGLFGSGDSHQFLSGTNDSFIFGSPRFLKLFGQWLLIRIGVFGVIFQGTFGFIFTGKLALDNRLQAIIGIPDGAFAGAGGPGRRSRSQCRENKCNWFHFALLCVVQVLHTLGIEYKSLGDFCTLA
jgi:hypothetical protein